MENNTNYQSATPGSTESKVEQGKWIPVDQSSLGFQLQGIQPNQPVKGPDGNLYCISESTPQMGGISANQNCAIPTPSGIVQMPPIVQPIALVPYTSQNQPMLQYDPYGRPLEPQVEPQTPNYIRRPYRGVSITAMVVALLAFILFMAVSAADFTKTSRYDAFGLNGIQAMMACFGVLGAGNSPYYSNLIVNAENTNVIAYILPFILLAIMIILLVLVIKYLVKFLTKRTPRCVSAGAIAALILTVVAFILLGIMATSSVGAAEDGTQASFGDYVARNSMITWGVSLIISLIFDIALIIVPLMAKKNAYYIEKDQTGKTYRIKD